MSNTSRRSAREQGDEVVQHSRGIHRERRLLSLGLAATGTTVFARVYLLRLEDLVALAQTRLTRSWTLDECQRFLHTDRCPV